MVSSWFNIAALVVVLLCFSTCLGGQLTLLLTFGVCFDSVEQGAAAHMMSPTQLVGPLEGVHAKAG
ncbi:MAG: hypothetical protein MI867_13645, partial [Pseudomonadales bacterium]|nr:hypothetical protein [Pseudomonadales bacterium]